MTHHFFSKQIETYIPPAKQETRKTSEKRKRPLIISQSKFGRQLTSTSTPRVDDLSSDSDEEHSYVDRISVERSTPKDRTIQCRFCDKQYQHIKARNKHLISDHFEDCKKVRQVQSYEFSMSRDFAVKQGFLSFLSL